MITKEMQSPSQLTVSNDVSNLRAKMKMEIDDFYRGEAKRIPCERLRSIAGENVDEKRWRSTMWTSRSQEIRISSECLLHPGARAGGVVGGENLNLPVRLQSSPVSDAIVAVPVTPTPVGKLRSLGSGSGSVTMTMVGRDCCGRIPNNRFRK